MSIGSIEFFLVLTLLSALFLLALAPVIERRGGQSGVTGALIVVLIQFGLVAVAGIAAASFLGVFLAVVALAMLVWANIAYLIFRRQVAADIADIQATPPLTSGANCRSRLVSGRDVDVQDRVSTWRSSLVYTYVTRPSNGELKTLARARGSAYYVIYFRSGLAVAEPTVAITCEDGDDAVCLADGSEQGSNDTNDPPARVRVVNSVSSSGSRVRVATVMGAALNASGGPTISGSASGVGVSLSFPDASLMNQTATGTYRWVCEWEEEEFEELS